RLRLWRRGRQRGAQVPGGGRRVRGRRDRAQDPAPPAGAGIPRSLPRQGPHAAAAGAHPGERDPRRPHRAVGRGDGGARAGVAGGHTMKRAARRPARARSARPAARTNGRAAPQPARTAARTRARPRPAARTPAAAARRSRPLAGAAAVEAGLDALAANTIRFLAVDAVEQAKSGHPGTPMGLADAAYVLWTRFLRYQPHDPGWPGRDRFVLSAGHASMLLYALLHLAGYDLPLEELRRFRQLGSRTPGHPEHGLTPGGETTTGPLGQGFGNGVGMAVAAQML